jgi:hypothetical protein
MTATNSNEECNCTCSEADFTATAVYTGENRLIMIEGSCECPTEGYGIEVISADSDPGIVPRPDLLRLQIRELPPHDIVAQVITHPTVSTTFDAEQGIQRVSFDVCGQYEAFTTQVIEPDA